MKKPNHRSRLQHRPAKPVAGTISPGDAPESWAQYFDPANAFKHVTRREALAIMERITSSVRLEVGEQLVAMKKLLDERVPPAAKAEEPLIEVAPGAGQIEIVR